LIYYYLFFEEIKHLLLQDKEALFKEGVNPSLYCSYQANAIIGIIIEWYQNDFSYSTSYLNDQLVQFLNLGVDG
ncbi:TetR family transcriptional regulator, partial [Bacillus cereus]